MNNTPHTTATIPPPPLSGSSQIRTPQIPTSQFHSPAWVMQTYLSFGVAVGAMTIAIAYLPLTGWERGYLGMGALLLVSSTLSLAKTIRDEFEAKKVVSKIEEQKLQKFLVDSL